MIRMTRVEKEYVTSRLALGRKPRVRALDGVTLEVPDGTALGVVGPNGAGKSTLIRLLLGYLRPSGGEIRIGDLPPRRYAERFGIAYVPERVDLPPGWTVRGALLAFAALGEVAEPHDRVETVMDELGIAPLADRRVAALSKGNLQRLALAQALLADRRVLVLDEPASGLDPEWTHRLGETVTAWRRADPRRVVVMASHDLDEVERTTDRVAVLVEGRVREMVELRHAESASWRVEVEPADAVAAAVADAFPGAVAEDGAPFAFRVSAADARELSGRLGGLLARGVLVRAVIPERGRLRDRLRARPAPADAEVRR